MAPKGHKKHPKPSVEGLQVFGGPAFAAGETGQPRWDHRVQGLMFGGLAPDVASWSGLAVLQGGHRGPGTRQHKHTGTRSSPPPPPPPPRARIAQLPEVTAHTAALKWQLRLVHSRCGLG